MECFAATGSDVAAGPAFWSALRGIGRRGDYEELLDQPNLDRRLLAENLRHIRLMNRALGWTESIAREVAPLLPVCGPATLLDLATGSADVPRALVRSLSTKRRRLRATGSDVSAAVLTEARALNGGRRIPVVEHGASSSGAQAAAESSRVRSARSEHRSASAPDQSSGRPADVTLVQHDAVALPFADGSFDVVTLCLAAHHLDPEPLQRTLAEMWRVARRGVVVGDLERSRPGYLAARLMALVLRNQLTSHDGPISILRAYTAAELTVIARRAGLERVRISHPQPFRLTLSAHKLAGADPFAGRAGLPYLSAPLDLLRANLLTPRRRPRARRTAR